MSEHYVKEFWRKEIQKQKWRDLLKYVIIKATEKMVFVLLGIENQSDIHHVGSFWNRANLR